MKFCSKAPLGSSFLNPVFLPSPATRTPPYPSPTYSRSMCTPRVPNRKSPVDLTAGLCIQPLALLRKLAAQSAGREFSIMYVDVVPVGVLDDLQGQVTVRSDAAAGVAVCIRQRRALLRNAGEATGLCPARFSIPFKRYLESWPRSAPAGKSAL